MPNLATRFILAAALCLLALAGCQRSSGESNNVSPLAREGESSEFDAASTPIKPDTHLAAGRLAESRGDLRGAAYQYRQVLKKLPDDPEALYRLGVVLSRAGDAQAVDTWKRYVSVTRNSAEAWGNLGLCYEMLGEPRLAEEAYQKGIARDSKSAACRVNYGMFLAARGDYATAATHFEKALPPAQGWYNIGSVCEQQGKNEAAIAAYQKALELDPQMVVAQRRLMVLSAQAPATKDRMSSTEPER